MLINHKQREHLERKAVLKLFVLTQKRMKNTLIILLRGMSNVDWILCSLKIPVFDMKIDANPKSQKNFDVSMGTLKTINSNILSLVNFSPGTGKMGWKKFSCGVKLKRFVYVSSGCG